MAALTVASIVLQEKWFGPLLRKCFMRMHDDKDGQFSFSELVRLMGPLGKGSPSQRAAVIFGAYDGDGSGLIDKKEVFDMTKQERRD